MRRAPAHPATHLGATRGDRPHRIHASQCQCMPAVDAPHLHIHCSHPPRDRPSPPRPGCRPPPRPRPPRFPPPPPPTRRRPAPGAGCAGRLWRERRGRACGSCQALSWALARAASACSRRASARSGCACPRGGVSGARAPARPPHARRCAQAPASLKTQRQSRGSATPLTLQRARLARADEPKLLLPPRAQVDHQVKGGRGAARPHHLHRADGSVRQEQRGLRAREARVGWGGVGWLGAQAWVGRRCVAAGRGRRASHAGGARSREARRAAPRIEEGAGRGQQQHTERSMLAVRKQAAVLGAAGPRTDSRKTRAEGRGYRKPARALTCAPTPGGR